VKVTFTIWFAISQIWHEMLYNQMGRPAISTGPLPFAEPNLSEHSFESLFPGVIVQTTPAARLLDSTTA
jgi:hypothetical protein